MGEPRQQGQVLKSPMVQVLALLSSKLDDCPSMQCRNWGVCECQSEACSRKTDAGHGA
jgi:hypothetical protein